MTVVSRKKIVSINSDDGTGASNSARITVLENNEYKVTYYAVVSGTSGTITPPTGATFNSDEFGASGNCVLSKIDGNNKPTFISPTTAGGVVVTASLNTTTGAWTASGTYTDSSVALIYSLEIKAVDYHNLTYNNIIETVANQGGVTTFNGGTTGLTPSIATSGAVTLAGTLVAGNGGTGISSYTGGDILYASGATTLSKLSASTTGTYLRSSGPGNNPIWSTTTMPNVVTINTVLYGQATNQVGFTSALTTDGSTFFKFGSSATINGGQFAIQADNSGRNIALYSTSTTASRVISFDQNTGSDNAFISHNGTATAGNIAGTTIAFAKLLEIQNGGGARINPISLEASRIYYLIGNTGTNAAAVMDSTGFRIGLMSDVQSNNLNGFTVESKSYFGANTTATQTMQTNGSLYFDTIGGGLIIKSGSNARVGSSTMVSGAVTVANTSVTSNTFLFWSVIGSGSGVITYTITAGTGFTFTSSSPSDTRVISWILIEKV